MRIWALAVVVALAAALLTFTACQSDPTPTESPDMQEPVKSGRLETVKGRGKLICASRNDVPGYGYLDASGNNRGFDIDICRAVAAAVLGDPNAIELRLITAARAWADDSVRRGRYVGAHRYMDDLPRCTVGQLRADHVLRRPGIHGQEGPRLIQRIRTERRRHMRNPGYDHRVETCKTFPTRTS